MSKKSLLIAFVFLFSAFLYSCASSSTSNNNNQNNNQNNTTNNTTNNTNNHTGACSSYCPEGKVCVGESDEHSTCVDPCPCPSDRICYNGGCIDLFNDPNNCGSGGSYCSGECVNGQCTDACAANGMPCQTGEECCDFSGAYVCKNTTTDLKNCGGCGVECDSQGANACVNGQCACGTGAACTGGRTCCSNSCKDLMSDVYNCGSCGNACGTGLSCINGQCMCGSVQCGFGESCCGNYCANLDDDPTNCGECGNNCGTGNGCSGGNCTCGASNEVCRGDFQPDPLMDCNGNMSTGFGITCHEECCDTGCAVTSASATLGGAEADPNNCGSCGNQCTDGICCCVDLMGTGNPSCECCSSGQTCGLAGCEDPQ